MRLHLRARRRSAATPERTVGQGPWLRALVVGTVGAVVFGSGGSAGFAAETAPGAVAEAWPAVDTYRPVPELVAGARSRDLPIDRLELAAAPDEAHARDTLVILVVLDERKRQTQWLVAIEGPVRTSSPTGANAGARATVVYGLDGREIRFSRQEETYRVLALGPWMVGSPDQPLPAREQEVRIDAAFFRERFVQAAGLQPRAARARAEGRLREDEWFTVLPRPPEEPDPAVRQRFVDEAGLTDGDERAIAASVPMLSEFARVIAATPGLREMLFSVVERPSIWSLVARLGRLETVFHFRSGEVVPTDEPPLGFSGIGPCSIVPFTLSVQGRPALDCTLLVAEPRVPLRMSGGIVAVVAKSPRRDDVRLIVRVLAARPGTRSNPTTR